MKLVEIVFSPTGGTQKAAGQLLSGLGEAAETVDLTAFGLDFSSVSLAEDDWAVIAVPVFEGRAPHMAMERLAQIRGNGAKAVLLCVYGNRAYEDALVELADTAQAAGFRVAAAVTAIAEHSIAHSIASGRPDAADAARLRSYAEKIRVRLQENVGMETASLPGARPYKKTGSGKLVPQAGKGCTGCGQCVRLCPAQAIDPANPKVTNAAACISCMRCIAVCPQGARRINPAFQLAVETMLKRLCSTRHECELFL